MFDRLPAEAPPPYYPNSENSKNAASSADKASTDDKRPPESPQISQKARDVIKSLDNLQENALMQLKKYDTIVVLDDSESMNDENRWQDACESLAIFSQIITQYDADGMDLRFLNRTHNDTDHITRPEIVTTLCSKPPEVNFRTDIGRALTKIVDPYLAKLAKSASKATPTSALPTKVKSTRFPALLKDVAHRFGLATAPAILKPLHIIVITDGIPTDREVLESIIRKAARATADQDEFPQIQIGFQFVQVGSDKHAKKWLEKLDGDKKTMFARDIVDTRPYSGKALDVNLLLSVLIGAFEESTDKTDAERWCTMRKGSAAPPEKRR